MAHATIIPMLSRFSCVFLLLLPLAAQQPTADQTKQQLEYTRSHYTKYEYRIPMRDGVKLFTSVYVPKDASQTYPILMQRTPYSVGALRHRQLPADLGPSELFGQGRLHLRLSGRARPLYVGRHVHRRPAAQDALQRPEGYRREHRHLGHHRLAGEECAEQQRKVGMWGISYPGFYAAFGLMNAHPALKAASPQAPMGDVGNGDDAYHNGAFLPGREFRFLHQLQAAAERAGAPAQRRRASTSARRIEYDFYLRMGPLANANETLPQERESLLERHAEAPELRRILAARAQAPHMKNVTPAVLWVGGWFDAEDLAGPLKLFYAMEKHGPVAPNTLVMGPWPHGGWSRGDGDDAGRSELRFEDRRVFSRDTSSCRSSSRI